MTNTVGTHPARATRAAHRLAAAGTLVALALSGCQAGVDDEDTTTVADTPVQSDSPTDNAPKSQEVTQTEAPAQTDGATEEPAQTDDGDAPEAGEIPAPGTEVEVGDTITTHVQTPGEADEEFYGYATLATTVTKVEKGDPELFESAENAEDFAGYTPWFVHVEDEWLTYEGNPNSNMIPTLVAFNESGGEVGAVINATWSAGIPGCELDLPTDKGVGKKATNCQVFAVPDDEAIGSVGWRGDDYADGEGSPSANPYYREPVLWVVP